MGGRSSENPAHDRDTYIKSVFSQGNRKAGGKGGDFNIANIDAYKEVSADYLKKTSGANYGALDEMNKLFSNMDALNMDLNTASIENMEFGDIDLANLKPGVSNKVQNDFMEQMKTIFDQRKKSILDRSLRPGQAATRGQML